MMIIISLMPCKSLNLCQYYNRYLIWVAVFNRLLSKPRFLWIFKNLNPNTYKGLFLVWKEI
ncbi:hypothetical protein [Moraxella lacunata]|uniref:hypothetical protein n=1 Tax=Moraxella lacunata TaxID=477 RepID=UPI003EE0982F